MDALDKNLFENSALSEDAKVYLKDAAKWGRFLSILGFVFLGFLILLAFGARNLFYTWNSLTGMPMGSLEMIERMGVFFTGIYLLMAVLYFFPTFYLLQFSTKMLKALKSGESTTLTAAFKNLKSMFKFWGILSIVLLSFYGLILLFLFIAYASR